jgi:hypothetical protein
LGARGGLATWNPGLLQAMVEAMNRGVTLNVVISNPGAPGGGQKSSTNKFAPYNGGEPASVNAKTRTSMADSTRVAEGTRSVVDDLCVQNEKNEPFEFTETGEEILGL